MAAVSQKKTDAKRRFRAIDKNGDNRLDFNEFVTLMRGLSMREAHSLFDAVDTSGDGTIDFDEFVEYIYSENRARGATPGDRSRAGRHARMAEANAIDTESEDVNLWEKVENVFNTFAGSDKRFESRDFTKLCKQCKLLDRKFTVTDCDLTFAKYKAKGERTLSFEDFKNCLRAVAKKRGISTSVIQADVAERDEMGVEMSATQTDNVRFHDDKSLYTGSHAANEAHGATGGREDRHARIAAAEALHHDEEKEMAWGFVENSFYDFCKGDTEMTGKEFAQLCEDCGLFMGRKFVKADADVIFSKVVVRGQRRIGFEQFKDACVGISRKRGCCTRDVQELVAAGVPQQKGVTQAENVRFHDDKALYTGMHRD